MRTQDLNAAAQDELLRLQVEGQARVTEQSSPEAVRARALRRLDILELRVKREQLARLKARLRAKAAAAPEVKYGIYTASAAGGWEAI